MQQSQKKLLSVIIPCYNVKKFLPVCFECLTEQTFKDYIAIFIDDGSTDGTADLLKDFCEKTGNVLYCQRNEGIASARNRGLEMVTTPFVTFVDSDDYIAKNHFMQLMSLISEHGADIAVTSYKRVKYSSKKKLYFYSEKKCADEVFDTIHASQLYLAQRKFDFCVWNKIFKTQLIKQFELRFTEGVRYGEESFFNYKAFSSAKKIVYSQNITYCYMLHDSSLVHSSSYLNRLDVFYGLNQIVADAEKAHPQLVCYAHFMRSLYICELLYFIKKQHGTHAYIIRCLINRLKKDLAYIRQCKYATLFRRTFIPLVPAVANLLLASVLKKEQPSEALPESIAEFGC